MVGAVWFGISAVAEAGCGVFTEYDVLTAKPSGVTGPTNFVVSNGATGRSAGNRGSGTAGLKSVLSGCGNTPYGSPFLSTWGVVSAASSSPLAPGNLP